MRLLLALVVPSLVFAGCLAEGDAPVPAASGNAPTETTALAHLDAARGEALQWSAKARLVGLTATEGEAIGDLVDPPLYWNTAADPTLGNGKALVWTYTFAGPNASTLFYVSKAADGTTLYARELPLPYYWHAAATEPAVAKRDGASGDSVAYPAPQPPHQPELVVPAIDSDAAVVAANAFEVFRDFETLHPRHQVQIQLGNDGGRPVWGIMKRTATYFAAVAAVDGATGELLHASSWPSPPPPPCVDCPGPTPEPRPEDTRERWDAAAPGRLSSGGYGGEVARTTFEVKSAYWFREARIQLSADLLPNEWIHLTVLDPDGNIVLMTSGPMIDEILQWGYAGTYTVEVRNDGFALRDVPFAATIDVVYGEPARRDVWQNWASLAPWNGPLDLPFDVDSNAEVLLVDLRFANALPTDEVRVRILAPDGTETDTKTAASSASFEIASPAQGAWRVTVWPEPTTVKPLDVRLTATVEYAPWTDCCRA